MLWLWRRLVATDPIRLLAWESPYAAGAAQEMAKSQKKKKKSNDRAPLTTRLLEGDIIPTFPKECLNEHDSFKILLTKRILEAKKVGKCCMCSFSTVILMDMNLSKARSSTAKRPV